MIEAIAFPNELHLDGVLVVCQSLARLRCNCFCLQQCHFGHVDRTFVKRHSDLRSEVSVSFDVEEAHHSICPLKQAHKPYLQSVQHPFGNDDSKKRVCFRSSYPKKSGS